MSGVARVEAALLLLALVTSCGANSSSLGSTSSSPKVGCLETNSTTHACTCSEEVGSLAAPSAQTPSCDTSTVGGVAACCALLDAGKDCSCQAYVCSYLSANSTSGGCTCYWGNDPLSPTEVCTGNYCCQSTQGNDPTNFSTCYCGDYPCGAGYTQVTNCTQSSPALSCPVGEVQVSDCLSY
jgi:hypothetical protein